MRKPVVAVLIGLGVLVLAGVLAVGGAAVWFGQEEQEQKARVREAEEAYRVSVLERKQLAEGRLTPAEAEELRQLRERVVRREIDGRGADRR